VGEPATHGPDPSGLADRGAEAPAPAGGYLGKPVTPGQRKKLAGAQVHMRLPSNWCGTERAQDFTGGELDNGAYRYHAIYAIPADGPNRFAQFSNGIQTDAFQASALLETAYGRAIRFDLGTDCGPQYLDISVVRLQKTTAEMQQLAPTSTGTLDAVSNGIDAAGFPTIRPTDTIQSAGTRTRNFVVWLDAPAPAGACGQATSFDDQDRTPENLNNLAGKVAVVFPNGNGGFCSSNTVRHEIGHNLGALQPTAPHAFDGAHCDDAYEDTMCYSQAPKVSNGQRGQFFDYQNDDYWDPPSGAPLPWWTANLNRFLCPDAACNVSAATGNDTVPQPDSDGDGVPDASDICPTVADPDQSGTACGRATQQGTTRGTKRKPTVKITAKRSKKNKRVWSVALKTKGEGTAVVTVRCRKKKGASIKTTMRKRVKLPKTVRGRVTCATKPRATILQDS
jgi:hypothetical protein